MTKQRAEFDPEALSYRDGAWEFHPIRRQNLLADVAGSRFDATCLLVVVG